MVPRARRFRLLFFFCLFLAVPSLRAREGTPTEYEIKAAFLYHFTTFVTWPPEASGSRQPTFQICILGQDPFDADLENTIGGKAIRRRPLKIRRLTAMAEASGCRILFISQSERDRYGAITQAVRNEGVLTVGESEEFAEAGGMIQFVLIGGKVRFAINATAAKQAGLKLSSKLLNLATEVLVD